MVRPVQNWDVYDDLISGLGSNSSSLNFTGSWADFTESVLNIDDGKYWGALEGQEFFGKGVAALLAEIYETEPGLVDLDSPAEFGANESDAISKMQSIVESERYEHGQGFVRQVDGQWQYGSSRDAGTWYGDYNEMLAGEGLGQPAAGDAPAAAEAPVAPDIRPYGQGFMRFADNQWQFGSSRAAKTWYGDYDEMLAGEGLSQPVREIIEPYGQGFMKAVEGQWRYGRSRDAGTWYADYSEMLEQEGLIQPVAEEVPTAPASVPDIVAALDPALRDELEQDVGEGVDMVMEKAQEMQENPRFAALSDEQIAQIAAEVLAEFSKDLPSAEAVPA